MHPPFYYLILHVFLTFVPLSSPIVAKLPALLFGVAIVPASYLLGRTLCGRRAPGFVLALLTTLSGTWFCSPRRSDIIPCMSFCRSSC